MNMPINAFSNHIAPANAEKLAQTESANSGFSDLIGPQAGYQDTVPLSTILEDRLHSVDSQAITFSLNGQQYTLIKNQKTGNIELRQGNKVIDSNVQVGSRYTPDGYIEVGGLSSDGSRIYIGRSPDNPNQIVAFVAKDLNQGDALPALTESNSTVLFTTLVTYNDLKPGVDYIVLSSPNGNRIYGPETDGTYVDLGPTIYPPGLYYVDKEFNSLRAVYIDTKGTPNTDDDTYRGATSDRVTGQLIPENQMKVASNPEYVRYIPPDETP